MANYRLTNKAIADLSDIWNYTYETWSEQQADKYYSMLLDVCENLAAKPEVGKRYDHVYPGLLGCKAYRHVIFYTAKGDHLDIVRILHSSMDLKNRLTD